MSNGIMYVLRFTKDEEIMQDMFLRMSNNDLFLVFNILEFLDEDTRNRWINVYNMLDKNNK